MSRQVPGTANPIVPEWLQNLAALGWRVLVSAALLVALVYIAIVVGIVTASILVAGIVAATFAPFVLRLRERGWSRTRASAAVMVGIVVVFLIGMALITLAFLPYVPDVVAAVKAGEQALQDQLAAAGTPPEASGSVHVLSNAVTDTLQGIAGGIAESIGTMVTIVVLSGFLAFYFLQDGDKAWVWVFRAVHEQQRDRITGAGDDALQRVGGYLRGTSVLAAINAVSDFVFLVVLGVPLAAPLAVLVFFGGFIPYIGGLLTTVVILLVAYATSGPQVTIVLFILLSIRNVILADFVRPLVYGRTVNIHPALVLVALPAGAAIAGIVGLFVAIPVTAMILAVAGAAAAILDTGVPPDDPLVPPWLDRLASWSWRLLVAIAVGLLGIGILDVMPLVALPLALATILAATFAPPVAAMVARGYPRGRAALIATFGSFVLVILVVTLTVLNLAGQASAAIASSASIGAGSINDAAGGTVGGLAETVGAYGGRLVESGAALASGIADFAIVVVLGCLLCFYFLRDGGRFWANFMSRLPAGRSDEVDDAGTKAFGVLGGYMVAMGGVSAFGAATQFLLMVLLGLPLALPLAVLSFIGGFVPYVGSLVTTGAALLVTIAVGSPTDVAVMVVFTIVFNVIQGSVVAPIVYSRAVGLHPAVVLMTIPAGYEIAGIVGMFLAVPVIAVVAVTWRQVLRVFGTTMPPSSQADHPT